MKNKRLFTNHDSKPPLAPNSSNSRKVNCAEKAYEKWRDLISTEQKNHNDCEPVPDFRIRELDQFILKLIEAFPPYDIEFETVANRFDESALTVKFTAKKAYISEKVKENVNRITISCRLISEHYDDHTAEIIFSFPNIWIAKQADTERWKNHDSSDVIDEKIVKAALFMGEVEKAAKVKKVLKEDGIKRLETANRITSRLAYLLNGDASADLFEESKLDASVSIIIRAKELVFKDTEKALFCRLLNMSSAFGIDYKLTGYCEISFTIPDIYEIKGGIKRCR